MYYELALISVVIGGGYWGVQFVRQESLRLYGALNIAAAFLAALGFYGERTGDSSFGVPGAIGVGAGACLLLVAPIARGLARRAAGAERFRIAKWLLDIADVLAPGSGVADEKALLAAMREIRDGNIEQTVDALVAAKHAASPDARLAIDERIAMLYLAAYRWDEAIAHAEEHLFGAIPPMTDASVPGLSLRRTLGIAPPVWVELLGAYGYRGNLDQAARMLARLEDVCAGRPDAGIWVHRGRLIFLALAGRVEAVQTLVEPKRSRHMKPAARTYWIAVAHERLGHATEAEAAYTKARSRSRGRPRVLIDQALARLPEVKAAELGPLATEVVTRVEAEPPPTIAEGLRPRRRWAVRVLIATTLGVAAAVAIFLGPSTDLGVLVRDGALVRSLVSDGEWWRFVSCIFVHAGGVHLLNVLGLWLIGRLCEDLFGPWRTLAIFALAALGGCAASFLASPAAISAGASGGMFGLVGAVFVQITWQRKRQRPGWPPGLIGALVLMTAAEVAMGFLYPVIDHWAHGGGLVVGVLTGIVFSPQLRWKTAALHVARAITICFALLAGFAAVMVVRTSIADSFGRMQLVQRDTPAYSATVPVTWRRAGDELFDPGIYMVLLAQRVQAPGALSAHVAEFLTGEQARAKDKEFDQVAVASDTAVPLPAGWEGSELAVSIADPLGTRQRYRVVVAGRTDGDGVIVASLYIPETIARGAPAFFTAMLASIRAR